MTNITEEKNKIAFRFLPKIKYIVLRFKNILPDHVDIDELYSAAYLGLVEALNNYSESRAISFDNYAEKRIRGAILDALRRLDHLPRNVRTNLKRLEQEIEELSKKLGRKPRYDEIIDYVSVDKKFINKYVYLLENNNVSSLDVTLSEDSGTNLVDLVKSYFESPDTVVEKKEFTTLLGEKIDELPKKERLVITLYYYEELTMKEIGYVLGITESRVSQLHSLAIKKIKRGLKNAI